jgi:hypothetical protein
MLELNAVELLAVSGGILSESLATDILSESLSRKNLSAGSKRQNIISESLNHIISES